MKEPKNILLINCDWRDIFRSDFDELYKKLQRDRLNPDYNHFYIFSWAHTGYHAQSESNKNFKTLHQKTYLSFFKPWFDLYKAKGIEKFCIKLDGFKVYKEFN